VMNRDCERILSRFPHAQCTQSQHFLLLLFFISATHMHPTFVKKHSAKVARFQGLLSLKLPHLDNRLQLSSIYTKIHKFCLFSSCTCYQIWLIPLEMIVTSPIHLSSTKNYMVASHRLHRPHHKIPKRPCHRSG
jgi:hypothetical protein